MVLLGTGWFFGIFMSIPGSMEAQLAMQYIFILLNSTQVPDTFEFTCFYSLLDLAKSFFISLKSE